MLNLRLCPRRTFRSLTAVVLVMAGLSVVGQVVRYHATVEPVRRAALLFKLSAEQTIPAYFAAILLLASAGLLWVIGRAAREQGRPFARHWTWLGVIFAYLSVDEALAIHELTIEPTQRVLGGYAVGVLYYAWVVPAAGILLLLGLLYLRFLFHLPIRVRNGVLAAAALYVGGAIGMEMVGSHYASTTGTSSIRYALAALIEETMEMLGVVVFIHALLTHLAASCGTLSIHLARGATATAAVAAPAAATHDGLPCRTARIAPQCEHDRRGSSGRAAWNMARSIPMSPPPDAR